LLETDKRDINTDWNYLSMQFMRTYFGFSLPRIFFRPQICTRKSTRQFVFYAFPVAYVEFPSVAGTHHNVIVQYYLLEGATHMGATIENSEYIAILPH